MNLIYKSQKSVDIDLDKEYILFEIVIMNKLQVIFRKKENIIIVVLSCLLLFAFVGSLGDDSANEDLLESTDEVVDSGITVYKSETDNKNDENQDSDASNDSTSLNSDETKPAETKPTNSLTTAQQNAIKSAKSYLSYTGFSRQGLIDQLVYEKYSTQDATLAVDSLGVTGTINLS